MTNQQHPITPPPELVEQWANALARTPRENVIFAKHEFALATQAAQWGADQELEACVEWLGDAPVVYNDNNDLHPGSYLRDDRRPKPSLKEQALTALHAVATGANDTREQHQDLDTIRQALEALPND